MPKLALTQIDHGILCIVLFVFGIVHAPVLANDKDIVMEGSITSLVVDLQDGFSNDTVDIRIDGAERYHQTGITTDYTVGLADSVEIEVPSDPINITISVPSKQLVDTITLQVSTKIYLGVSIDENSIKHQISNEMFVYF